MISVSPYVQKIDCILLPVQDFFQHIFIFRYVTVSRHRCTGCSLPVSIKSDQTRYADYEEKGVAYS